MYKNKKLHSETHTCTVHTHTHIDRHLASARVREPAFDLQLSPPYAGSVCTRMGRHFAESISASKQFSRRHVLLRLTTYIGCTLHYN